jgi:8-oxo-dGTP pyrophosphatase MutT (NUDIX family)
VLFADLIARLDEAFTGPLPGAPAQMLMAPRTRRDWPSGFDPADVRPAAGLLLIYPVDAHAHIALTVRSERVRHGGQVSLPGGVVEPGESFEQAALRESHEEIALDPAAVRLVGRLTPIDIPVSGFRLHPIAAILPRRPVLMPADAEVDRILDVPVATLMEATTLEWRTMTRGALTVEAPAFNVADAVIWGATAMVLAEFLFLLGWRGPQQGRS